MSQHAILESVELARNRLAALRVRLEQEGVMLGVAELLGVLRDSQDVLDSMQGRCALLRDLLEQTNEVVFAKDEQGRYAMINSQGADILGKTVAEVLGAGDRDLFTPAEAKRTMAIDREVMSTGKSRTREETFELRGVSVSLLTTTSPWYDGKRSVRGVIGTAHDVTERRHGERDVVLQYGRLRSLATEIVISEERLRQALATELHAGLGQDIALVKLKLSMLRSSVSAELHEPLGGIEELVERADRSLRSITFQISPPSLHDLGLVAALQWLGEDIGRKYGIDVRIEEDDFPRVGDGRVRVILFRAVRELLINTAIHANVGEVSVQLRGQDGHVQVSVHDAGAGFDATDFDQRGYGLFGIREQLRYVDGQMKIESVVGRGTKVTLTAPATESLARPTV
jgi:PAS domain S-box-containing protein